uniref:uncharacterized protein LOC131107671 isoform X2 n=1 Tax=Doryrhamphus excisus TaxID=161450 RepID=UPI0025AEBAB7|nr:uncharacterized protein LOC131107671 isoform X2 [Doryrhamphus excisus]
MPVEQSHEYKVVYLVFLGEKYLTRMSRMRLTVCLQHFFGSMLSSWPSFCCHQLQMINSCKGSARVCPLVAEHWECSEQDKSQKTRAQGCFSALLLTSKDTDDVPSSSLRRQHFATNSKSPTASSAAPPMDSNWIGSPMNDGNEREKRRVLELHFYCKC